MTPAEKITLKSKLLQAVDIILSLEERVAAIEDYIIAQNKQYDEITDEIQKQLLNLKIKTHSET